MHKEFLRHEKILQMYFKVNNLYIKYYYRLISASKGSNKSKNTYFKVIYLRHNRTHASRSSYRTNSN